MVSTGFCLILLNVLQKLKPDYIAASLDTPEPTFRDKEYAEYKAKRAETSSELIPQLKNAGAQGIIEYPLNKVIY